MSERILWLSIEVFFYRRYVSQVLFILKIGICIDALSMPSSSQNFDLERRMLTFAQKVRDFCSDLPRNPANTIYGDQLLRSSSSIGANYIEANDALGKKDFLVKIRTARREAKETRYWLNLLIIGAPEHQQVRLILVDEAMQLIKILSAIALKVV